jgi:deazaflavin-dependent oxidoreductase (nitroreductase family)
MNANRTTAGSAQPKHAPRLPPRWVIRSIWALHRFAYRVSRGRFGLRTATADRAGYLRLKTVGRRTGKERRSILAYVVDGQAMVTLAMNGWGEAPPAWWFNLQAQPDASVDLSDGSVAVSARLADTNERPRLWAMLDGGPWGDINGFAAGRSGETPVVILERRD